jgi:FixJ family two-component response regulator
VDDEPMVLEGLFLHLRRHYKVLTERNPLNAVRLLREHPETAVIISDMRMPGMDGATLLTTARDVAPDAVRILLTGHADAPSAMAAVNQGEVYRFLAKPCPPTALAEAVRTAVEHHHHLLAERELLERTLNGSIQLVIQVLEMANPVLFGRASQIRRMSAGVAQVLGVRERWPIELAAMFSRLAWISLPPETAERLDRGLVNSDSEQEMIDRLPQVADQLLSHVPRLGVVREILRVCDRVVGEPKRQPGNSEAELVITGSRILRAVLDFDTLQASGMNADIAISTLRGRDKYDQKVLDALADVSGNVVLSNEAICDLNLHQLKPGMVFADDLRLMDGPLLVPRGYQITDWFLTRLHNFRRGTVREPVRVRVPLATKDDAVEGEPERRAASEPPVATRS